MFHIHVDAKVLPEDLHAIFKSKFGFVDDNFVGHPEGYMHFEPNQHLSLKVAEYYDFSQMWGNLVDVVSLYSGFIGYLEGEYIKSDEDFLYVPYVETSVPFQIKRRRLSSDANEQFRQSELHFVCDREKSDPRLIAVLLETGLYGAYIPKTDHSALVLTAQGYRKEVSTLLARLSEYLQKAGGIVQGSLKEEIAIAHELFGFKVEELPEIIGQVNYF